MKKSLFLLPLLGGFLLSGCQFTIFGKTVKLFEKDSDSSSTTPSGDGSGSGVMPSGGGSSGGGSSGGGSSGGGSSSGGGGSSSAGQEVSTGGAKGSADASSDAIVFDFTNQSLKDGQIFPYVTGEAGKLYEFEYGGYKYNDIGCFVSTGYQGAPNYLMMKNKDYSEGDKYGDGNWSNKPAFIGNKTPFAKPIKKVIVTINAGSSANAFYRATIHTQPQTECAKSGGFTCNSPGDTFYTETTSSEGYYFTISTNKNSSDKLYNGQISKLIISF